MRVSEYVNAAFVTAVHSVAFAADVVAVAVIAADAAAFNADTVSIYCC